MSKSLFLKWIIAARRYGVVPIRWLRSVRNWVNAKALREDLRKIGLAWLTAGFIGWVLPADQVDRLHATIILLVGTAIWILGLGRDKDG